MPWPVWARESNKSTFIFYYFPVTSNLRPSTMLQIIYVCLLLSHSYTSLGIKVTKINVNVMYNASTRLYWCVKWTI